MPDLIVGDINNFGNLANLEGEGGGIIMITLQILVYLSLQTNYDKLSLRR